MGKRTVDSNSVIATEQDWRPTLFDLEEFQPKEGNPKMPLTKIKRKSIATDQIVLRSTHNDVPIASLNKTVR